MDTMKKTFRKAVILTALVILYVGVGGSHSTAQSQTAQTAQTADSASLRFNSLKKEFLKKTDLQHDLSKLSMSDLLLLRSSVYAANGLFFRDENLYTYFMNEKNPTMPWYKDYMCFLFHEAFNKWTSAKKGARGSGEYFSADNAEGFATKEEEVKLSAAEKGFADKIDGRVAELRKNGMYVNKNGYTIGNTAHIVNTHKVTLGKGYMDKLAQNNFVIAGASSHEQLFHLYEENDYLRMPSFVTTDLFLQAFHMYLSYALKVLEEKNFIPALEELTFSLYKASMELSKSKDGEVARIAEYSAAFYAVPYSLLTGKKLKVAVKYQNDYINEVNASKAAKADGQISGFLSGNISNDRLRGNNVIMHYSLFKPRGHYTRKPKMEAYFKAMMWLQKAYACRDDDAQLKQNIYTAGLLNTVKSSKGRLLADVYASIFEPTAVLVGEPNNLSTMDIAQFLKKENVKDVSAALNAANVEKVNQMLIALSGRIIIKPKILTSCSDKINFMPQRYLIDNEVLQELVDVEPDAPRAFPKGLDVFSAFGSAPAADLLNNFYKEKEKWDKYPAEMEKLRKKFNGFDGWNKSVYNKWIEALLALQKSDKSYPVFMNTKAWDYKNLNTSLASWAELKHDFILYADQPFAAESGGGEECNYYYLPAPDIEIGYVEPNILFWNKLDELIKFTANTLAKHNLLDGELKVKNEKLQEFTKFLIDVSKKELAKKPLSHEEYGTIAGIGGAVEHFTLTVMDPDESASEWSMVTGPDRSIAVVADVYTRNVPDPPGCPKNGILHVATGNANEIYVVVEIDGYLYLTRGATFTYYEFVMPPNTRLTDDEWQKMEADKSKRPPIQEWMKRIVVDKQPAPIVGDPPPVGEAVGCFVEDCDY